MKAAVVLLPVVLLGALFSGCLTAPTDCLGPEKKFSRVFCWGIPTDEETARKYSEIGVTDIRVNNEQQLGLALKYGMTPYCGTFGPRGEHAQVMSVEEEKHWAYINGHDLKEAQAPEKKTARNQRRTELKHRYGGEPDAALDTLNDARIACFLSDAGYERSKKTIDEICACVPGVKGIYFDYLGYTNFKGCYCGVCLNVCTNYLAEHDLVDNPGNRDRFYRDALVSYYNDMIDYVKGKHPDFKVVVHVYPTFLPEPLYGNRTKADFCGQTVAWYFPWAREKIGRYTRITVGEARKYHPEVQGIPFVGLNTKPGSLWVKDAATLEKELQTILEAGGDTLMVCNGADMLDPGIFEVFRKYCGK